MAVPYCTDSFSGRAIVYVCMERDGTYTGRVESWAVLPVSCSSGQRMAKTPRHTEVLDSTEVRSWLDVGVLPAGVAVVEGSIFPSIAAPRQQPHATRCNHCWAESAADVLVHSAQPRKARSVCPSTLNCLHHQALMGQRETQIGALPPSTVSGCICAFALVGLKTCSVCRRSD
eukprot:SAG31_NODE_95_length_25901_cov_24.763700_23_plen_173_part_00